MVADESGFNSALYDSTISLDPQLLAQADGLMEKVAMCTFVVFPKEKRLFFSRGMTDYIGPVAAEDMLLDNFLEFTDPDEQRNLKVRYEEAFYDLAADNHKVVSFEHNIISRSGHLYHVRVNMQAVKKENHLLIFGMMEDYTSSFGEIVYERSFFPTRSTDTYSATRVIPTMYASIRHWRIFSISRRTIFSMRPRRSVTS